MLLYPYSYVLAKHMIIVNTHSDVRYSKEAKDKNKSTSIVCMQWLRYVPTNLPTQWQRVKIHSGIQLVFRVTRMLPC